MQNKRMRRSCARMEERVNQYCQVVLIGAGASGLLCGSLLARQGIPVMILEKNSRAGRKLSATGNGRCNFTNLKMDESCYYGETAWIRSVLQQVGPGEVIRLFQEYGIWHRQKDGYVYPHTNQASTVVDLLVRACVENKVKIYTDCLVQSVEKRREGGFRLRTEEGYITCKELVLATGGRAGAETGGDDSGYLLARTLGHRVTPLVPGLTGLICGGRYWPDVAGSRIQGRFSLNINGKSSLGEKGEIQIVKKGVSGIPVFQLCHMAAHALEQGRQVEGVIDFVPSMDREASRSWIRHHGLDGLLPKKWIPLAQRAADPEAFVRSFTFPVLNTFGLDRAQVTAGGVPVSEICVDTMESKVQRGLYLLGELLDVDGKCGGYNLHLAWATAILAARGMIKRRKESD